MALSALGLSRRSANLIALRQSIRVGIVVEHPARRIVDGVSALTRNPIHVAFAIILAVVPTLTAQRSLRTRA